MKYNRSAIIALLALTALTAGVLFVLQTSAGASAGSSGKMYWTDFSGNKIQRANLDGSVVEDLVTGGFPQFIALDPSGGKMYWTDSSTGKIQRANLDGSGAEDVVTGVPFPRGIALDVAGGKMYWTTFSAGKIQRANLDGSGMEDLITGLTAPLSIALDVAGGKMYWTDSNADKIQRASLDGSGVEDLVTGLTRPRGIALDVAGGKMYWTDTFGHKIQRANLDGSGVEDLVTGLAIPAGIALDVAGGKMYWTDAATDNHKIQRANLDGSGVEDLVTALVTPQGIALDLASVDLVLTDLYGPTNQFDDEPFDGKVVVSLATDTTNIGTVEAEWFNPINESHLGMHPHFWFRFIIQPSDGAPYVVVGQSDIKNGIAATNSPSGCNPLVVDSDHLWPGCTDIYSSVINTTQWAFIPLADFNLETGVGGHTHMTIPLHAHADTDHLLAPDEGFVLPDDETGTEGCPAVGFPKCYIQVDIWHTQETGDATLNNAGYIQVEAQEGLPLLFAQVGAFTQDALVPVNAPLTTATPCVLANPVSVVGPLDGSGGSPAVNAEVTTTFTGNIVSTSNNSVEVCAGTTVSWTFGGAGPPPTSSTLDGGPDPGSIEVNEDHQLTVTNTPDGGDTDNWSIIQAPTCPTTPDADGDGLGDSCDPCPANPDCDGDGWTDRAELYIGTDPLNPGTPGGLPSDPAPVPDGNCAVQIDDVAFAAQFFGSTTTPRAEIASQNGTVGIDDVVEFASRFGDTCS